MQVGRLDGLVGNYGDVYVDKVEAQRLETEKRIHAWEGVSDSSLREMRNECIGELKKIKLQLTAEAEKHPPTAHVGTFRIRYPPTSAKITSGDQAASTGGNWLMLPMASNRPETTE